MIFIINSQGTTQSVLHEPVYQGSNGANQIILVAPFAQSVNPTVAFTLPNGIQTEPLLMTPFQNNTGEILYDADKNAYNMWSVDIDYPITEYAGLVDVQFTLYLGSEKVLGTYTSAFEVGKGVPNTLPKSPSLDTYAQILNYLSSISADAQLAIDNAIAYVKYTAPSTEAIAINSVGEQPFNAQIDNDAMFSVEGVNKFLTDFDLKQPNASGYFYRNENEIENAGFIVGFEQSLVGTVQLFLFAVPKDIKLQVAYYQEGSPDFVVAGQIDVVKNTELSLSIYQFTFDEPVLASAIRITQISGDTSNAYICKGVELFKPTSKGQFVIAYNNGLYSRIDTYNATTYLAELTQLKNQAEAGANSAKSYADESKNSLEQLNKKANAVGGYPVLEEVKGEEYPKIPSIYLNQIDIKEYKKITSESELNTIAAQKGDVAILVEPEKVADKDGNLVPTGENVITKSWLLYDVEDEQRTWIKYGLSYATNAGYATYANNAGNASKINGMAINKLSQSAFNNLEDKNGIYFVVIGE